MKSLEKLIDNLSNEDFRKAKVDLKHSVDHIMKQRIEKKKQEIVKQMNEK